MKAVAILGAGPAGLMAAHACALTGQPVAILSYPKKSVLGGAQFLHERIPELTDDEPHTTITYRVEGSAAGYEAKAYGSGTHPSFVSMDNVHDLQQVPGWNLRVLYERLWEMYGGQITEWEGSPKALEEVLDDSLFSLVISSIPRRTFCHRPNQIVDGQAPHRFEMQTIAIKNGMCPGGSEDNTVWYSGSLDRSWHRCSRLFGVESTEWGWDIWQEVPYDLSGIVRVRKPVMCQCDCFNDRDNLVRVGRFGRWQKGLLVNDAFKDTVWALNERGLITLMAGGF